MKVPVARMFRKAEYTIREAAELRGVHPRTVRRQIKRGDINARVEFVAALQTSIYYIPRKELPKIQAKPGRRTDLV